MEVTINMRIREIVILSTAVLFMLVACGSESSTDEQSEQGIVVKAAVCTEGEGRDSTILFQNLNDFTWAGVVFSLDKGGRPYTLGEEAQSMQGGRDKPTSWAAESSKPAVPFAHASDWTNRPVGETRASSHKAPLRRLTHLGYLDGASVKIRIAEEPGTAEWTGPITECQ